MGFGWCNHCPLLLGQFCWLDTPCFPCSNQKACLAQIPFCWSTVGEMLKCCWNCKRTSFRTNINNQYLHVLCLHFFFCTLLIQQHILSSCQHLLIVSSCPYPVIYLYLSMFSWGQLTRLLFFLLGKSPRTWCESSCCTVFCRTDLRCRSPEGRPCFDHGTYNDH